ncbi:MAG TPA: hypothetical protein H9922_10865 [Candidatus Phocaeicola caecigallinarum]|nr:hypothetical protein [Candidatus Phocaeicola caecigallinarum]
MLIWNEFLRHFRLCDEGDSGLSDEESKAHTETNTSSQEKLFVENNF